MNNYHWYIKQEIDTAAHEMGDVVGFQWDLEKPLRAHVATRSGWYQTYDYCWDTFISSFVSEENAAYAAVVDGGILCDFIAYCFVFRSCKCFRFVIGIRFLLASIYLSLSALQK